MTGNEAQQSVCICTHTHMWKADIKQYIHYNIHIWQCIRTILEKQRGMTQLVLEKHWARTDQHNSRRHGIH